MSTPVKSPNPLPPKPVPVDVNAYHPLGRLRRVIRTYVILEGVLTALVFAALWFWLALAIDFGIHYFAKIDLLDSAPKFRYVLVILFSGLIAGVLAFYVLRRLFTDFSSASLALVLEKKYPELLGDRLITAVELANLNRAAKQGYSIEMIVKTMKDARERVDQVTVGRVFNWRRLVLLGWVLFGVTAIWLLAVYPLTALLALLNGPRGEHVGRTVLFNSLILTGCVLLFWLPFACIYCWRHYRKTAYVLLGCSLLGLGLTAVAYDQALKVDRAASLHDFSWRLYHAAGTAMNRDLSFGDERWPKDDYHLELLDFPVPEKRVETGKYVTARAYFCRFIVADNSAPSRWRPAVWNDLAAILPGENLPTLPLDEIHAYIVKLNEGLENSPVGYDAAKLDLPGRDDIKLDLVLAAVTDQITEPFYFNKEQYDAFQALAKKLSERAADPRHGGRHFREVSPPEELKLVATRTDTQRRQTGKLRSVDGRKFVFQLEKPLQIDESLILHAEAEIGGVTAKSSERKVTLVQPPKMQLLSYQEFRPAYFYYLPPEAPRADTIDQRRKLLRKFRQELREIRTSMPPEQSVINISYGSELTIRCTTDKPLREVSLVPQNVEFPGIASKDEIQPVRLKIDPDGKSFTVRFAAGGKPPRDWLGHEWMGSLPGFLRPQSWFDRELLAGLPARPSEAVSGGDNPLFPIVARTADFELVYKDADNMTSSRSIKVKPTDDKLPEVNLFVDVIRRVKNRYMCTAQAAIPFAKESYATDDYGLHKIEFTYEYSSRTSDVEAGHKAEMAAWLWANSPIMPTIGDYLYRRELLLRSVRGQKTGPRTFKGAFPVASFDVEMKKFGGNFFPTLDSLAKDTAQPLPDGFTPQVLNRFEFKLDDQPEVFDLRDRLPRLRDKDPVTGAEPVYDLVLNVRVTDSNVLTESDRSSENKENPLVFEVVPVQVLFSYIAREEGELARKFDDVIKRLEAAQRNLQGTASRVAVLSAESATSEQTRLESILEVVSKSRELTGEIGNDYARILNEYLANRFDEKLSTATRTKIVEPLRDAQAKEFTLTEDALNKFHASMRSGDRLLAQPLAAPTLENMDQLVKRLIEIRRNMGDTLSLNQLVVKLQAEINNRIEFGKKDIKEIEDEIIGGLLNIRLTTPVLVNVAPNKTVKVPLKIRMPETITVDPFLRFEIDSNSGLKVTPNEIKLKDDSTTAEFEITAGAATGTFSIRIVPTQGKPVDLKVLVK